MWSKKFFKTLLNLGIPEHMVNRASIGFNERWKPIKILFEQQKIPKIGWDEEQIQFLLKLLSSFDSDKDPNSIRIGEREARVATNYLTTLTGGFNHGIGRSGELAAPQPKAAGASMMQSLTNKLTLSLIKSLGLTNIKGCLTVPLGTGMSLAMAIRGTLNHHKVDFNTHNHILYCRADHKSPIKAIEFIGGKILQVEGGYGKNKFAEAGVYVDFEDIKKKYIENKEKIKVIISTTSFFAPRVHDDIKEIAKFANENNLIHIINNAYGIQSQKLIDLIRSSIDAGRVDAIVQSTDKNFLTPVGGAVVISPKKEIIQSISKTYAGRATSAPIVQLLVSLLKIGEEGYKILMDTQIQNMELLIKEIKKLSAELEEEFIDCENPISCVMSLKNIPKDKIQELGGYLYNLRVTGPRILDISKGSFGTNTDNMPWSYAVLNAAIGVKKEHISRSIQKLREAYLQIKESQ